MKRNLIEMLIKDVKVYNPEPNNILTCDYCLKMYDYMAF